MTKLQLLFQKLDLLLDEESNLSFKHFDKVLTLYKELRSEVKRWEGNTDLSSVPNMEKQLVLLNEHNSIQNRIIDLSYRIQVNRYETQKELRDKYSDIDELLDQAKKEYSDFKAEVAKENEQSLKLAS